MSDEPIFYIVLELEAEAARWRRRTLFLVSVLLHGVLIALIIAAPDLFRRGARMMGIVIEPRPRRETTFLYMPPDLVKPPKLPPETNNLSDKNRRAEGKSPAINPNALRMPYSLGNTPLPEIAGGAPPAPRAPAPAAAPPPAGPKSSGAQPAPKNEESHLLLMDVPPPSGGGGDSQLRLPTSPGEAIQQSLQAAARGRASGSRAGPGDGEGQFNNPNSNFSMEGPTILSDTRGVDFGPYLARIVMVVRRNWYSVMPESARLGEKGRVSLVFRILKDGSVPQLRLAGSSGSDALDRAAAAGINLSIPFPPLPAEFTGDHLDLQFIFLYNLGYGP